MKLSDVICLLDDWYDHPAAQSEFTTAFFPEIKAARETLQKILDLEKDCRLHGSSPEKINQLYSLIEGGKLQSVESLRLIDESD